MPGIARAAGAGHDADARAGDPGCRGVPRLRQAPPDVTILPVYGGQPIERQLRALEPRRPDRGRHARPAAGPHAARHAQARPGAHRRARRSRRDARHGLHRGYRVDPAGDARRRARPRCSRRPCPPPIADLAKRYHARPGADHRQIRAHDRAAGPPDLLRGRRARQVRGADAHPRFRDAVVGDHLLPHQERSRRAGRAR